MMENSFSLVAIPEDKPLRVNRRGLVKLSEEAQNPIFTADKLYHHHQLGLSCQVIAKKIGVDTSKEEVINVGHIQKSECGMVPDIKAIKFPISASFQRCCGIARWK